jgi:transposase
VSLSQGAGALSCPGAVIGLAALLPHLSAVEVEGAVVAPGLLVILARARPGPAACPGCGSPSERVNSRYRRHLADPGIGGRRVVVSLLARRLFCDAAACARRTFAEQPPGLASRCARRTDPAAAVLAAVAVALAGRAGARLAAALGLPAGRGALLRLLMAAPVPEPGPVRVLGVDDFALRRGRRYATVLVDLETGAAVDVLPDREAATLRAWLEAHPGAEVICRDRAGAYAEGARDGAPAAIQVADRWHLLHNLAGRVTDTAARHLGCLAGPGPRAEPAPAPAPRPAPRPRPAPEPGPFPQAERFPELPAGAHARRTAELWENIRRLRAEGLGVNPAARALGIDRNTVRRHTAAASPGALLAHRRPSTAEDWKPWILQRWNEGAHSAKHLHAEAAALGCTASYDAFQRLLKPLRATLPAPAPGPPAPRRRTRPAPAPRPWPPKASHAASWILKHPANLDDWETQALAIARARCPHLDGLAAHVAGFARILTARAGAAALDNWLERADADAEAQPDLQPFANGIRRDYQAVANGLTLPWSSGPVEGTVNRIKMLKRQTYGRAGFPLLRQRVLLNQKPPRDTTTANHP